MTFEANALGQVSSLLSGAFDGDIGVQPPLLYHYDEARHMLMMSDGGVANLKGAYESLSRDQIQGIGHRLGHWLATLHECTPNIDIGPGGNLTAKSIYRYAYRGLVRSIKHWHLEDEYPDMGSDIDEVYGSMLNTDDANVCMGDFWPGNVVIGSVNGISETSVPLTIVDWEMTRRGTGATDVGQFLAEAFLLDRFRLQNKGLAEAFFASYMSHATGRSNAAPTSSFIRRIGVHCGVHLGEPCPCRLSILICTTSKTINMLTSIIGFWPTYVKWTDEEKTKQIVQLGLRVIGIARDPSQDPRAWTALLGL